jgi:hypothetical protein
MKPLVILATLLTSLHLSKADFYVWAVDIQDFWGGQSEGYAVYAGDPSCADVGRVGSWNKQSDVSGRKTGVRCNGNCGLGEDPDGITQFEMHWTNNPLFHWSESIVGRWVR